jgi:hypothetical protein
MSLTRASGRLLNGRTAAVLKIPVCRDPAAAGQASGGPLTGTVEMRRDPGVPTRNEGGTPDSGNARSRAPGAVQRREMIKKDEPACRQHRT